MAYMTKGEGRMGAVSRMTLSKQAGWGTETV